MSRVTVILVALVGILAGALGYSVFSKPAPQTDTVAVQAMIADAITTYDAGRGAAPREVAQIDQASVQGQINQALAAYDANRSVTAPVDVAQIDPATLNPMIESFLMSDPKILQRMSLALDTTRQARPADHCVAWHHVASPIRLASVAAPTSP